MFLLWIERLTKPLSCYNIESKLYMNSIYRNLLWESSPLNTSLFWPPECLPHLSIVANFHWSFFSLYTILYKYKTFPLWPPVQCGYLIYTVATLHTWFHGLPIHTVFMLQNRTFITLPYQCGYRGRTWGHLLWPPVQCGYTIYTVATLHTWFNGLPIHTVFMLQNRTFITLPYQCGYMGRTWGHLLWPPVQCGYTIYTVATLHTWFHGLPIHTVFMLQNSYSVATWDVHEATCCGHLFNVATWSTLWLLCTLGSIGCQFTQISCYKIRIFATIHVFLISVATGYRTWGHLLWPPVQCGYTIYTVATLHTWFNGLPIHTVFMLQNRIFITIHVFLISVATGDVHEATCCGHLFNVATWSTLWLLCTLGSIGCQFTQISCYKIRILWLYVFSVYMYLLRPPVVATCSLWPPSHHGYFALGLPSCVSKWKFWFNWYMYTYMYMYIVQLNIVLDGGSYKDLHRILHFIELYCTVFFKDCFVDIFKTKYWCGWLVQFVHLCKWLWTFGLDFTNMTMNHFNPNSRSKAVGRLWRIFIVWMVSKSVGGLSVDKI